MKDLLTICAGFSALYSPAVAENSGAEPEVVNVNEEAEGDGGKKKGGKPKHPLVGSDDREIYPFRELPADFDPDTHKRLGKKDFATAVAYFTYAVTEDERKLERTKQKLQDAKDGKGDNLANNKKRLATMASKMQDLRVQLEAQGIDVDEFLAAAASDDENAD